MSTELLKTCRGFK